MMHEDDGDQDNPFDRLQLDPRHSPRELTEILQRRAERASPAERAELQRLWRRLTLKESDRVRWALLAHPRSSRAQTRELRDLQDKIPPFISRYTPPALEITLSDIVTTPGPRSTRGDSPRRELFTPPLYRHDEE